MIKKALTFQLVFFFLFSASSQDVRYAREVLNKLASQSFKGRGYVKYGDKKAAAYLADQFEKKGVKPFDSTYFQNYNFPINTFPGKLAVKIDGQKLVPGQDYVISSSNSTLRGEYPLIYLPDSIDDGEKLKRFLDRTTAAGSFLVSTNSFKALYGTTVPGVLGFVVLTEKTPFWHVSKAAVVESTFWLKIQKTNLKGNAEKIYVNAENEYLINYPTQNVIAVVEGKVKPDRYVVFTAHYDHLGKMGRQTYFPGANDNASGTAMLMDLARYYAQPGNQPDYSILFMAFSGEESGLHGSKYYVEHPLFMLEAIRLLINLDMVGTGSEGITVVNGIAYKELHDKMMEINERDNLLSNIKARGEACNSDHCPFYDKGVKSIFIYTMGQEHTAYHTIYDSPENFPFTAYDGLFKLLTTYVSQIE